MFSSDFTFAVSPLSAVERRRLNTFGDAAILLSSTMNQEVSITEERYQQLKGVLRKTKEAARQWIEALKEIKLSGRWKAEAATWEAWCVEHAGMTATAIRMVDYRERKRLAENNPEPDTPKAILKAERVIKAVTAKLDREAPPPVLHTPQVIDVKPIGYDVRVCIHRVAMALDKLLQNSLFATSESFRHCVSELHHVDKLLQPELFPAPQQSRGSLEEVIEFCVNRGLKKEDGEWFFEKCQGCGWKNNGKAIVDWRSTVRAWQALGTIFPSQKQAPAGNGRLAPTEMMVRQKELESAERQIKSIKDSYTDNMAWSKGDVDRFKVLRNRRDELKKILGIMV